MEEEVTEEMLLAPPPLRANISYQPGSRQEAAGSSKPETEEGFMKALCRGKGRYLWGHKSC